MFASSYHEARGDAYYAKGDKAAALDQYRAAAAGISHAAGGDPLLDLKIADLAANGELPHSATLKVLDLAAAEAHAEKLGVRVVERGSDSVTLDPADCFGAVWSLTERAIPGDPRPSTGV